MWFYVLNCSLSNYFSMSLLIFISARVQAVTHMSLFGISGSSRMTHQFGKDSFCFGILRVGNLAYRHYFLMSEECTSYKARCVRMVSDNKYVDSVMFICSYDNSVWLIFRSVYVVLIPIDICTALCRSSACADPANLVQEEWVRERFKFARGF